MNDIIQSLMTRILTIKQVLRNTVIYVFLIGIQSSQTA